MATNIYNFTNQKLNAGKLREILSFNSFDFGGVVTSDPNFSLDIDNTLVTLRATEENPVTFIGGGLVITQTSDVFCNMTSDNMLWYLKVELDESAASIVSDELLEKIDEETAVNKITFESVNCDSVNHKATYHYYFPIKEAKGNPNNQKYCEYDNGAYTISQDEEVDPSKIYYYSLDVQALLFKSSLSPSTFLYLGNTLWINDNTFIIPLCVRLDENTLVQVVNTKDVADFSGILSMEASSNLNNYCDTTFMWSSGGFEPVDALNSHRKGDIGDLNITKNIISNRKNNNGNAPTDTDPVEITNLSVSKLKGNNITDKDTCDHLYVDSDGNLKIERQYIRPISVGGTGASDKLSAKINLGIRYGETQNPQYANPEEGDVWLWILPNS